MDVVKEKYMGESQLSQSPKKKIGMIIRDGAITLQKLSPNVAEEISKIESLEKHFKGIWYIDEGLWEDEKTYRFEEYDETLDLTVTSDVWWEGCRWRCLRHQPYVEAGAMKYDEPKWNSLSWKMISGSELLTLLFNSSNGTAFRLGEWNTTITPHVYCGYADISEDLSFAAWKWTRCEERNWHDGHPEYTQDDLVWNANHQHIRILELSNADMPSTWSIGNKTILTLTVEVNDGKDLVYVENQIIA